MYQNKTELSNDEMITVLKGLDRCSTLSSDDHPEFKALRDLLEQQGFISTQRNAWNGDRVLKPFKLNEVQFNKGDRYLSGAAMKSHLQYQRKHNHESV